MPISSTWFMTLPPRSEPCDEAGRDPRWQSPHGSGRRREEGLPRRQELLLHGPAQDVERPGRGDPGERLAGVGHVVVLAIVDDGGGAVAEALHQQIDRGE